MTRVETVNSNSRKKKTSVEKNKTRKSKNDKVSLPFFLINKSSYWVGECFYIIFKQIPLNLVTYYINLIHNRAYSFSDYETKQSVAQNQDPKIRKTTSAKSLSSNTSKNSYYSSRYVCKCQKKKTHMQVIHISIPSVLHPSSHPTVWPSEIPCDSSRFAFFENWLCFHRWNSSTHIRNLQNQKSTKSTLCLLEALHKQHLSFCGSSLEKFCYLSLAAQWKRK